MRPEQREATIGEHSFTADFAALVDGVGGAARGAADGAEIDRRLTRRSPERGALRAVRITCAADHLPGVVEIAGAARRAAERAQIDRRAGGVVPQRRMTRGADGDVPGDLADAVDGDRGCP